jgi:uncharacterized protein (TIGR03435 family)
MRSVSRAVRIVAVVSGFAGVVSAQTSGSPAFDVASIKPNKAAGSFAMVFQPGGRFIARDVTLRMLVAFAYGIPESVADQRISGGPKWIGDNHFDITAKAETVPQPASTGPRPDMLLMVRALLADRFKLAVHTEKRDARVYALVLARRDGRFGQQLRSTPQDCVAWLTAHGRAGLSQPALTDPPCGRKRVDRSTIAGSAMTMPQLADLLSARVERIVRDRTGLGGYFDLDLRWTPEEHTAAAPDSPRPALPAAVDITGPSLFTALQEQLGLKLESRKESVGVLVIDRAEPPTAD